MRRFQLQVVSNESSSWSVCGAEEVISNSNICGTCFAWDFEGPRADFDGRWLAVSACKLAFAPLSGGPRECDVWLARFRGCVANSFAAACFFYWLRVPRRRGVGDLASTSFATCTVSGASVGTTDRKSVV